MDIDIPEFSRSALLKDRPLGDVSDLFPVKSRWAANEDEING